MTNPTDEIVQALTTVIEQIMRDHGHTVDSAVKVSAGAKILTARVTVDGREWSTMVDLGLNTPPGAQYN